MPLTGERLIIEPTYPNATELMAINAKNDPLPTGVRQRNEWWSSRLRCHVIVWEEPDGSICHGKVPGFNHLNYALSTLGSQEAWGIEQEHNAVQLLATLLSHRQMKQYLLTGMFLETSRRSRLTYMFRRLRPTIVVDARDQSARHTRILCTLCLHPIGYYYDSWAGAMCPTDDVVAHLMLMRGDEPMFWRRANQHAPDRPESGI